MKRIICAVFILFLITPLFTEEFSLKKKFNDKPIFDTLQLTAWMLIDLDTVFTYRSRWHYGIGEANPFWRPLLDKPALVFALDMVIKVGITWSLQKLYKRNKYAAYFLVVAINLMQISVVYGHLRAWRR